MNLKKNDFYVYGLIDPRNGKYFYIGKGKGKRFISHLKETRKNTDNIWKHLRIKEIEGENLQVGVEIIFPHLSEKDALKLEKIVIYKIGRKAFNEGDLLNFVPGGIWSPGESFFYETELEIDFELESLDFIAKEKFLSIEKTSNIIHLDEIEPNYLIYKYDLGGTLISIDSIVCFCKTKQNIGLFFEIHKEQLPILLCDFIYSKNPINDFYYSEKLSLNQYLFDPLFMKTIDDELNKKNDFFLELSQNGLSRIKVRFVKKIFQIETFFTNSQVQNIKFIKHGQPFGKWIEYFEDGKLKCKSEFFSNGNLMFKEEFNENEILICKTVCFENGRIRKTMNYFNNGNLKYSDEHSEDWQMTMRKMFYPNGQMKFSYNNYKTSPEYKFYNESGRLIEEFIYNKGFVNYDPSGKIISISKSRHIAFSDPYNILNENQSKKLYNKIIGEDRRKSDEDWKLYNDLLND